MTMKARIGGCLAALLVLAVGVGALGAPITSPDEMGGPQTVIDFSQFVGDNQFEGVTGPVQIGDLVGADVEASSDSGDLWLYNSDWGLVENGIWDSGRVGFAGIFPGGGPIRFTFNDGPVSGVGGFVNYPAGEPDIAFIMSVYDSGGNLLESFDILNTAPISTPDGINEGAFRGIQRAQADIAYMELTGLAGVLDDLRFTASVTAVPEPSTFALAGLGGLGLAVAARRRRRPA